MLFFTKHTVYSVFKFLEVYGLYQMKKSVISNIFSYEKLDTS